MRSLLTLMKQAINSQHFNGDVPLFLLTFESEVLAQPLRVVHNTEDIISNGYVFKAVAFECQFLDERAGEVVTTTLTYYDVDQEMIELVRLHPVDPPIQVTGRFILASDPDDDQIPPFKWISSHERWNDKREVTFTVGPRSFRGSSWPVHKMDPGKVPGIFGGKVS